MHKNKRLMLEQRDLDVLVCSLQSWKHYLMYQKWLMKVWWETRKLREAVLEWGVFRISLSLHSAYLMAGNKVPSQRPPTEEECSFNSKEWGGTRGSQLTWATLVMEVIVTHQEVNSPYSIQSLLVTWMGSNNKFFRWTKNCLESVVVPFNKLQVKQ